MDRYFPSNLSEFKARPSLLVSREIPIRLWHFFAYHPSFFTILGIAPQARQIRGSGLSYLLYRVLLLVAGSKFLFPPFFFAAGALFFFWARLPHRKKAEVLFSVRHFPPVHPPFRMISPRLPPRSVSLGAIPVRVAGRRMYSLPFKNEKGSFRCCFSFFFGTGPLSVQIPHLRFFPPVLPVRVVTHVSILEWGFQFCPFGTAFRPFSFFAPPLIRLFIKCCKVSVFTRPDDPFFPNARDDLLPF